MLLIVVLQPSKDLFGENSIDRYTLYRYNLYRLFETGWLARSPLQSPRITGFFAYSASRRYQRTERLSLRGSHH